MSRFRVDAAVRVSRFQQISDQPAVVTDAIDEFAEALIEALGIVLIVSFISIGWRAGLVVAITIPLVLAATFAVMLQLGIDLQRISLGALIIALGLLVDDAMIVVEMMERKLQEGFARLDAASFAYRSTAFPMLSGTLITVAGFIPVGFAASTAGEYVRTPLLCRRHRSRRLLVRRRVLHALARPYAAEGAAARGRGPPRRLRHAFLPSPPRDGRLERAPARAGARGDVRRLRRRPVRIPVHSAEFLPAVLAARDPGRSLAPGRAPARPRSRRRQRPSRPGCCPIPTSVLSPPISAKARRVSSCRSTSSSATRTSRSSWSSPRMSRRASG